MRRAFSNWLDPRTPEDFEQWTPALQAEWRRTVTETYTGFGPLVPTGAIAGVLMIFLGLRHEIQDSSLVLWASIQGAISAVAFIQSLLWKRAPNDELSFRRHSRLFVMLIATLGTLWGIATFFIWHIHDPIDQLFMTVLLVAVSYGGATASPLTLGVTWFHTIAIVLPLAAAMTRIPSDLSPVLAATLLAYGGYTLMMTLSTHQTAFSAIAHRFANARLLADVSEEKRRTEQLGTRLASQLQAQKATERELLVAKDNAERAARSKSEFLANMSHEIRTPMNGVLGMTELLLASELNRKQRHFARTIHRSAESLLGIINDVLDFSKIEAGKLELQAIPFDLQVLMEDIGVMFAERANRAGIELQVAFPPKGHSVYRGDPDRLRQVLTNLVGNALKFTSHGEVVLRVKVEKHLEGTSWLRFDIKDTGVGIAQEHLGRIFDSFSQGDSSTTRKFGGTGLGLAICKRLTQLMGGEIGVESTPGRGSTFWFTCPLPIAEPSLLGVRRVARPMLTGRQILVVDESQTSLEVLTSQLENWDARVTTATNADGLLNQLLAASKAGTPVELLIFDRKIVDDPLSFSTRLRRDTRFPRPRIIVLGNFENFAETGRWFDAGVSSYLAKPVRPSELYDTVADALGMTRPLTHTTPTDVMAALKTEVLPHFDARVLAVEDNPVNQELVRILLENLGCRVTMANNGQEAVDIFTSTPLDDLYDPIAAILMDLQMPVMDGFAATAAIRAHESELGARRHIPIIALTANALEGDRERCLKANMDDYLSKPFTQRQLANTLVHWLPTAQMGDTLELPASTALSTPQDNAQAMQEVIDGAALDRITSLQRAGAPSILGRVIELFLDSAPKNMAAIRASIEQWDPGQLEHAAHSLKSSAANLGAMTVSEYCRQLELMGREKRQAHARDTLVELETAYRAAARALQAEAAKIT